MLPSLLATTVMIAAIFALMPVDQASTVHTQIQDTTSQVVIANSVATSADGGAEFTITCNTQSNACRILEAYIDDDDAGGGEAVDVGIIQLRMNGETLAANIAADGDNAATDGTALIAGVSGLTITADDVLTINIGGLSDNYNLTVIAEVDGDSSITLGQT